MVMPAVASLAAARDARGLERIKYDGPRLHLGLLLPVALLAWIYAGPFLSLWVGDRLGYDAARVAPLMRLFLVATIPLVIAVHVQMAIGMGRIKVVALSALAGSLVNLPISYVLTTRLGVAGVIWGTVLTTLFSNLLVPGDPRLPRPGDQAGDVPGPDPGRPAGRGRRPGGGDLRLPRPDPARPRGLGRPGPIAPLAGTPECR